MSQLIDTVKTQLINSVPECDFANNKFPKLHFGISGGFDSMVLTHILSSIIPTSQLFAIHIRHYLEKDEDLWQEHCQSFCQSLKINFQVIDGKVNPNNSQGMESIARKKRIAGFFQANAKWVLIATHANDLAESLLIRILRHGCGSTSLSLIKTKTEYQKQEKKLYLIRPLLSVTKAEIIKYANENNIKGFEDPSNFDQVRARAYVRSKLLPSILDRHPNFLATVAKTTEINQLENEILIEVASTDFKQLRIKNQQAISRIDFIKLTSSRQINLLRYFIRQQLDLNDYRSTGLPSHTNIKRLINLINIKNYGCERIALVQEEEFKNHEYYWLVWIKNKLWVNFNQESCNSIISNTNFPKELSWEGGEIKFTEGKFSWNWIKSNNQQGISKKYQDQFQLYLDIRRFGDNLKINNRPNKSMRKWMNELAIPKMIRAHFPVIRIAKRNSKLPMAKIEQAEIAACCGIGVNYRYLESSNSKKLVFQYQHSIFGNYST